MQQVYLNALWLKPPTAFGRRLLPLSLGHAYLLEAIESACLLAPANATRQDCIVVAWICCRPWRKTLRQLPALLAGKLQGHLMCWGAWQRRVSWERSCDRIMDYLRAYTATPARTTPTDRRDRSPRVPWPLAVAYGLGARTFADAVWDMPVSEAFAFHAAGCAAAGDTTLRSEFDLATDAILEEMP